MIRKAKRLAKMGDLEGIKRLARKYFQWANAISNVWEFEQKQKKEKER